MTVLPIVERELRVASRLPGTYWMRTGVAAAVIAIGSFIFLSARREAPAEVGKGMFIGLGIIAGLFCLFAGARATADCLAEEKRDGTLGLLFLTDLGGFDVVAGKLVAGSLNTVYGLLAVLPMLALPLLMGGVRAVEFWRVALTLLNTLFFSLCAGMIASALTRSALKAAMVFLLIVLLPAALMPLAGVIYASLHSTYQFPVGLIVASPGFGFYMAFDSNYASRPEMFILSLTIIDSLAWGCLIASCLVVPRSWQDKAATVTRLRWRDRWNRWSLGSSAERARFRARLLDVNAFYWLASRSRIKPPLVWAVLGSLSCIWIWGWMRWKSEWADWPVYITTAIILNTILKCWFCGEVCSQISEDRRTGAMELLLSTPLEVHEILRGQFRALCRQFLWPAIFIISAELAFLVAGLRSHRSDGDAVLLWICGWAVLVTDLAAIFYVGIWKSLTARSSNRANSATIVRIMSLPWIIYVAFLMLLAMLPGSYRSSPSTTAFILIWTVLSLFVSGYFGIRAKLKMEEQFRQLATTRYTKRASIWKRLFGSKPAGAT